MTPKEFLEQVSPDNDLGIRADLQRFRLRSIVCGIMERYAKLKVEEQRKLLHDTISELITFDNENDRSNFVIDVMNKTKYPNF